MAPPMRQPEWFDEEDEDISISQLRVGENIMEMKLRSAVINFTSNYSLQYDMIRGGPPMTAGRNILVDSSDDILLHIASYLFGGKGVFGSYCEMLQYAASLRGVSKV
jgi:hypothetical protein